MAQDGYMRGKDASYAKPKLIPDDELLPRDNSGGTDWEPHTGQWGDGGYIMGGSKPHLSPSGDGEDETGVEKAVAERKDGERGYRKPGKSKAD